MALSNYLGSSGQGLTAEKMVEMKQIIHDHIRKMDLQSALKDSLESAMGESEGGGGGGGDKENISREDMIDENRIMSMVKEKGIMDKILRDLGFESNIQSLPSLGLKAGSSSQQQKRADEEKLEHPVLNEEPLETRSGVGMPKTRINPKKRHLYLQFLGGKAFVEYVSSDISGNSSSSSSSSTLTLDVHFRSQRFRSRPAICACEPDLKEGFLLQLEDESDADGARMATQSTLLAIQDTVHIVIVKTDTNGDRSLVTSHRLDWRSVLSAPKSKTILIELIGVGSDAKVPVGALELRLQLIPHLLHQSGSDEGGDGEKRLTEEVVIGQQAAEKSRWTEKERLFLNYAKQWWREFLSLRPDHTERVVKIFAQDETGLNRPVCSYVRPWRCGRLLDSPRHAARFVSLIPLERIQPFGGSYVEQWYSSMSFISRLRGDVEPHACFLCSLLLGFGLDAYVLLGSRVGETRPHAWVMTRGGGGGGGDEVTFWESLTGQTYTHIPTRLGDLASVEKTLAAKHRFAKVGCAFNHKSFFANIQPIDDVQVTGFDFADESRWKSLSPEVIRSVLHSAPGSPAGKSSWELASRNPPLVGPNLDPSILASDLEHELKMLIAEHRRNVSLLTSWDDDLGQVLHPSLTAYELDRILGSGNTVKINRDFQHAIRHYIPEGHTFKGYPLLVLHRHARRILSTSLRSSDFDDVISCRGDQVALAIRAHITLYPENIAATWLMFAVRYKLLV